MSVSIRPNADTFVAGPPTALFQARLDESCDYCLPNYNVAADGRFLMSVGAQESSAIPINLILNWPAAPKK
jgi:hypothetical protein